MLGVLFLHEHCALCLQNCWWLYPRFPCLPPAQSRDMLCWCFLPLIFFFQSYMVTPSDKSPCVWRRSRHFLHLSSYPPLSLWLLVISISEMLMGGTLELNWIHGHFSHWLGRKTSIKTAALSGSGYSPGGGRWGFRSLFLNLEKGTSEKWALQDRRKRSEKVKQHLGARSGCPSEPTTTLGCTLASAPVAPA